MYICEIVSSNRNKDKINVYGYIMLKDKNRNHNYYWYCEKWDILKCNGRASTILTKDQYNLVKFSEHNHAAEASQIKVIQAIVSDKPQTLESFIIPENMKRTLDGVDFLVRDLIISNKRLLIFTTSANINYLAQSSIWIMDGTFKTIPNIFKQLYTIH
ncbi:15955_t:CDS:2, partial [Funneliformis geosporum]